MNSDGTKRSPATCSLVWTPMRKVKKREPRKTPGVVHLPKRMRANAVHPYPATML